MRPLSSLSNCAKNMFTKKDSHQPLPPVSDLFEFAHDLYDVLGMNTNYCTQQQFYNQYVRDDNSFTISDEGHNKQVIHFNNFTITIKPNK